jgi:hypothetical protein
LELIERIELFQNNRTEQHFKRIKSLAENQSRNVDNYLIPFTMELFNESRNFIQDGWLSYSFPTQLHMIGGAMKYVRDRIYFDISNESLFQMISDINEDIQRLDLSIDAMEKEREAIHLTPA